MTQEARQLQQGLKLTALRHRYALQLFGFPKEAELVKQGYLNGDTTHEQPASVFSTWTIGQLEAHAATLAPGRMALETVKLRKSEMPDLRDRKKWRHGKYICR